MGQYRILLGRESELEHKNFCNMDGVGVVGLVGMVGLVGVHT